MCLYFSEITEFHQFYFSSQEYYRKLNYIMVQGVFDMPFVFKVIFVIYLLLCKNYPHICRIKIAHTYHLILSVSQGPRLSLSGFLRFRISYNASIKIGVSLQSYTMIRSNSKLIWLLAELRFLQEAGLGASSPWQLLIPCSTSSSIWLFASSKTKTERIYKQGRSHYLVPCNYESNIPSSLLYSIRIK